MRKNSPGGEGGICCYLTGFSKEGGLFTLVGYSCVKVRTVL